ncbi:MAG: hypothetical protein IPF93_14390 [Saprospiraceae bacterium]|nr:hypothetical protein [Saprospiraceae bacterium]
MNAICNGTILLQKNITYNYRSKEEQRPLNAGILFIYEDSNDDLRIGIYDFIWLWVEMRDTTSI